MRKILIAGLLCFLAAGCALKSTSCKCGQVPKNCCESCPDCKAGGCFCEPGKCKCECCCKTKAKSCNTPGCTCPPDAPCSKSGCMDCKTCGACGTGCSPTCKGCKE